MAALLWEREQYYVSRPAFDFCQFILDFAACVNIEAIEAFTAAPGRLPYRRHTMPKKIEYMEPPQSALEDRRLAATGLSICMCPRRLVHSLRPRMSTCLALPRSFTSEATHFRSMDRGPPTNTPKPTCVHLKELPLSIIVLALGFEHSWPAVGQYILSSTGLPEVSTLPTFSDPLAEPSMQVSAYRHVAVAAVATSGKRFRIEGGRGRWAIDALTTRIRYRYGGE
jgi:hypothetical protein